MDWEAVGVAVSMVVALIGGNAFLMKLVIGGEISKCLLLVAQQYVTKEDFEKHIEHCPHKRCG